MTVRIDDVDRRIIHALMEDARNTSAPMIAEGLDVSPGTVRNRIERLETEGVIQGYTATVDFEQADGRLMAIYMCTVPAADREQMALSVQSIPRVVNVRVLMAGRRDLHVIAVGESTEDLRQIARHISELDIRIEDEELVQTTSHSPYSPFGPENTTETNEPAEIGHTTIEEVTLTDDSTVVGMSIGRVKSEHALDAAAVISIQRDGKLIQPTDETVFEAGDVVALHVSPEGPTEPFRALD